jgi:tetratricopeptide (TPR) repeat protein
MKTVLPEFYFDENLREVCKDPETLKIYAQELKDSLKTATEPKRQVALAGELAVRLRSLYQLDEAEEFGRIALNLVIENNLGVAFEIQQKIRLAHVLQWQERFSESNALFAETIELSRNNEKGKGFLAFALQHSAKNFFDQHRYREALELFNEALNLRIQEHAPEDQIESTKLSIARTRQLLARQV